MWRPRENSSSGPFVDWPRETTFWILFLVKLPCFLCQELKKGCKTENGKMFVALVWIPYQSLAFRASNVLQLNHFNGNIWEGTDVSWPSGGKAESLLDRHHFHEQTTAESCVLVSLMKANRNNTESLVFDFSVGAKNVQICHQAETESLQEAPALSSKTKNSAILHWLQHATSLSNLSATKHLHKLHPDSQASVYFENKMDLPSQQVIKQESDRGKLGFM